MATDSSVAGYISPVGAPVIYDDALDDAFQRAVVGITGLPGALVRPRYQKEMPNQPDFETNWCAMGVTKLTPDLFAHEQPLPAGEGSEVVSSDEILELLLSFYGPNSNALAETFRAGLMLTQNREALRADANIALVNLAEAVLVPTLTKQMWVRRVDVRAFFRRRVEREYAVLSLLSGQFEVQAEVAAEPVIVVPVVISNS